VEVFRVKVQGTLWGDASGIQQVGDKKASGTVRLTNLTDEMVFVPQGTVIRTLSEPYIRFETTQNVTLPGGNGQSREVTVRALVAGSQGIVPAQALGAVEGDLGLSIAVENPQAVFGGSDRQGRVVSEADAARVYDTLITSLAEDALQELENLIPSGKKLLPETLVIYQIDEKVYQPGIGELADRFVLNLQVEFEGWAYDQAQLDRILNDAMNANLPNGMTAVEGSYKIHDRRMSRFVEGEFIEFTIEASRLMEEKIEAAQLTAAVRGLPLENALRLIQQQFRLTGLPEITVSPAWFSRLPFLTFRIAVEER